jgi:hypothetical protein
MRHRQQMPYDDFRRKLELAQKAEDFYLRRFDYLEYESLFHYA